MARAGDLAEKARSGQAGWLAAGCLVVSLLAGCARQAEDMALGYVEGDFLYLASEYSGLVEAVLVEEGERVGAGATIFRIRVEAARASLAAAEARVEQARSELADLRRGAREERLAMLRAAVEARETDVELGTAQLERRLSVLKAGGATQEAVDEAGAFLERSRAHLREAREQLALEALPAREERIAAAEAALAAAEAELDRQREILDRYAVAAPSEGVVHEVVRRPGELAPAGGVVVVFLPDAARRAIFFVGQHRLSRLRLGDEVEILVDGIDEPLAAPIRFIASEVEFAPPVIYSPEERERLLVRVEASVPVEFASQLKPGQPISVRLPTQGEVGDE